MPTRVAFALRNALSFGVLSIGKLNATRAEYYVAAVAHGAEDYYTGAGEVPGYWIGTAAARVGLTGEVNDDQFRALLAGTNPVDGTVLARANRRVAAYDLTFSAPKSVSVVWALGGPDIARAVVEAHADAIASALGYLEREAVHVRRGHDGTERLLGAGLIGAAFRHRTSRAGDPQLHTHVVVANATCGADGAWSALDGRDLYAHLRTAGFLYQAELRTGLYEKLNVIFGPVHNGQADLVGVPDQLVREFSRRRAEIEVVLDTDTSAAAAHRATLSTRRAKDHDVNATTLYEAWAERGMNAGFGRNDVEALCAPRSPTRRAPVQATVHPPDDALGRELTERSSSFDRRDVLRAIASTSRGARVHDIEAAADRFLAGETVVALGVGRYGLRYTTPGLLAMETRLVDDALARQDDHVAVVENLEAVLARHPELSAEQRRMVRALACNGAGVSVVIGAAGAGKTHALAAARDAWHDSGYTVVGAALAARAARQLHDDTRVPASTIDALLQDLDRPDTPGLTNRSVLVIDEAAMVGTRHLARLTAHARRAGAKLVLVGDPKQLPEIDAGGAFMALARRLPTIRLHENRRQHDPTERHALHALRGGHVDRALELLERRGHVTLTATADQAHDAMVRDWYAATARGDDAIMLAGRRGDVADLNQRARALALRDRRAWQAELHAAGRAYGPGDRIVTLHNDRRAGLINGQRGTVTSIDGAARALAVRFDGAPFAQRIPAEYLDDGHVDHAYAMTIHKAQGLTCDRAYILASDELYAEAGYTALTRGRDENHLYISDTPGEDRETHDNDVPDGADAVRRALTRPVRELAGVDQMTYGEARSRSELDSHPTHERGDGIDVGW